MTSAPAVALVTVNVHRPGWAPEPAVVQPVPLEWTEPGMNVSATGVAAVCSVPNWLSTVAVNVNVDPAAPVCDSGVTSSVVAFPPQVIVTMSVVFAFSAASAVSSSHTPPSAAGPSGSYGSSVGWSASSSESTQK